MHWEARFREHAAQQHGLVAKFHLPGMDCTAVHWTRALDNGRWDALSPRVIRLSGTPESDEQRALAAVLDASPGAVLHGRTTLAWFGVRGYDLAQIHVARPRGLSGLTTALGKLHRLRDVRAHDVVVVRGVPTETPLRAIWSEAARFSRPELFEAGMQRIGRLLDTAHVSRLVTWAALHEAVHEIAERGRRGTTLMRALAAERQPGSSPTESRNEARLEHVLSQARVVPLRRQAVIGGHEPIGRVDFRDDALPLAVEVNSVTFHSSPSDRANDEMRYLRLNDAGFTVAVVWEDDLWSRPSAVVELVVRARRSAQQGERVVMHSPSCPWPPPTAVLGTPLPAPARVGVPRTGRGASAAF